jgi:copper(I)-binding protein
MAHDYTLGALKIGNPWSLPVPAGAPTAAGYLTVTNTGKTPDRLIGADGPEVDHVEIHEMTMDGAVMRMRPVSGGVVLPPGRTVTLAPGGYHLMLIGPKRGFKVGEHIAGTLRFEHAGTVKVEFEVQTAPPGGVADHSHMEMH